MHFEARVCLLCLTALAAFIQPSYGASNNFVQSAGGSNFVWIRPSDYGVTQENTSECGPGANPYVPDTRPILAVYNPNNPAAKNLIDQRLDAMYAAGQRKISLMLWHYYDDAVTSPSQCFRIKALNTLPAPFGGNQGNIYNLIQRIKQIGFNQIIFRFSPQGDSSALSWTLWNDDRYKSNRDIVFSTHDLVTSALAAISG